MMRPLPALLACAAIVLAGAGVARAGEGESALSLGLAYGSYLVPDGEDGSLAPAGGAVLAVEYERAFGEAFSLRGELAGAIYGGGGLAYAGMADVGLVYRLDVLKYVPYLVVAAGVAYGGGGPLGGDLDDDGDAECEPGDADCGGGLVPLVQAGAGLDVLRSRDTSWGVELRFAPPLADTTFMSLGVRYTRRWGYF
ncbi:MAG: hypothetical protein R2939_17800 [Kofleriaceae bacterium]